jgi:hypothetical protein
MTDFNPQPINLITSFVLVKFRLWWVELWLRSLLTLALGEEESSPPRSGRFTPPPPVPPELVTSLLAPSQPESSGLQNYLMPLWELYRNLLIIKPAA